MHEQCPGEDLSQPNLGLNLYSIVFTEHEAVSWQDITSCVVRWLDFPQLFVKAAMKLKARKYDLSLVLSQHLSRVLSALTLVCHLDKLSLRRVVVSIVEVPIILKARFSCRLGYKSDLGAILVNNVKVSWGKYAHMLQYFKNRTLKWIIRTSDRKSVV